MMERIRQILGRIHAEQSGAIALLLLASILILFMTALVIYDAGIASQDKMDAQIGADSAAYSHTVVKARSMNMIAYANTIKRMIFSYLATYVNAWLAILAQWAYHASRCFRIFPDISSCITWALAIPMIISEGIELVITNMPSMGGKPLWNSSSARSRAEIVALENYSMYMFAITPWWAYVEGVMRGMTNGALMTAAWPVPGSQLSQLNSEISGAFGIDSGILPGSTNHTDVLPIDRRDHDNNWNNVGAPYQYGSPSSSLDYCLDYALSLESIVTGVQTYTQSYDHPDGWENTFAVLHLLPSIGCLYAAWSYSQDGYTDWRLKGQHLGSAQNWLAATASLHVSYTPRAGRNEDNGGERQKFTFLSKEASVSDAYKNEGYFAMARSELVYKQPFQILDSLSNIIGSLPIVGGLLNDRLGIQPEPDMWSPRWKAKLRPMILPGERFGSAVAGQTGFNIVSRDVIPYLALGSIVGIVGPQGGDPPFSVGSAVKDFIYLYRSGLTWDSAAEQQGIAK